VREQAHTTASIAHRTPKQSGIATESGRESKKKRKEKKTKRIEPNDANEQRWGSSQGLVVEFERVAGRGRREKTTGKRKTDGCPPTIVCCGAKRA